MIKKVYIYQNKMKIKGMLHMIVVNKKQSSLLQLLYYSIYSWVNETNFNNINVQIHTTAITKFNFIWIFKINGCSIFKILY